MSCYTRQLEQPMRAAGLTFDASGKREADRRIRAKLGMTDAHCPEVWARLKTMDPDEIVDLLREPVGV